MYTVDSLAVVVVVTLTVTVCKWSEKLMEWNKEVEKKINYYYFYCYSFWRYSNTTDKNKYKEKTRVIRLGGVTKG